MIGKFKKLPLEKQLVWSFFLLASFVIALTMTISVFVDIRSERRQIDNTIGNIAEYVASLDSVVDMLEKGYPDPDVQHQMDSLCDAMKNVNVLMICDRNKLRFYHTKRQDWGDSFVDGEEAEALAGQGVYITTGLGTNGEQRRAFCAIKNQNGETLGFVMTGILNSNLIKRSTKTVMLYLALLPAALLLAMMLSRMIVRFLQNSLQGHKPNELLNLYLMQEEMLNALADGLVITDADGKILIANRVAQSLFEKTQQQLEGTDLAALFPASTAAQPQTAEHRKNYSDMLGTHSVMVTEMTVMLEQDRPGMLSIFTDKTETMRLSDELSGTKNVLDSLRFFNHEYMNKLHVILGYLQIGETQQAMEFIMNSSLVSSQSIREAAAQIRVSKLCALIVGKMMRAAELGIRLTVQPDSICMENDLLLPVQEYVTIVGNLLENAIEELSQKKEPPREIHLGLYCRPDCNVVLCEDTGRGIDPAIRDTIFIKGVSSKGENRGIGLYAIHELVERYHGTIEIESEKNEGTEITLTFTRREEKEV